MSTPAPPARLSTTSEGLWLTAALAGVSQLPPVLKVRPIGAVAATLSDHPGVAVLEQAGVCRGGGLDGDVAEWVATLGRPDVELDVVVSRPETAPTTLAGPPSPFEAPIDTIQAAEALTRWHAQRPPQRAVALCRRAGVWVAAARLWRSGNDSIDEVVISPLGSASIATTVCSVLGASQPAQFHGINVEAATLEPLVARWQADPGSDIVAALIEVAGLSVPQAKVIQAAGDATATRAVLGAAQFSIDGPCWAPLGVTVIDTVLGRVVISNAMGPDARQWTTVLPGTDSAVATAVDELLDSLPCGPGWVTHQRTTEFDAR
uniref:ESX-1 secretion-associated protein EspG1 n=1 Tax=Mycobacterium riyadhense TaxID=486698 RepID=A0A653EXU1_9MYCO|nr:hypothetical protein BIN_B_04451 [Mycobacterium riyadhense]